MDIWQCSTGRDVPFDVEPRLTASCVKGESKSAQAYGEIDIMGEDVGGIAVNIAARVLAEAADNEVWVSRTVKDLVVGSGFNFTDKGSFGLKGVPGEWSLFSVEA